jgi:aldehyde dehydrogenase (NAD+)
LTPVTPRVFDVVDPATEAAFGQISMGGEVDVDHAVAAATRAFRTFGQSDRAERASASSSALSRNTASAEDDLAWAVSHEMGAPKWFAHERHVVMGLSHLDKDGSRYPDLVSLSRTRAATAMVVPGSR